MSDSFQCLVSENRFLMKVKRRVASERKLWKSWETFRKLEIKTGWEQNMSGMAKGKLESKVDNVCFTIPQLHLGMS